MTIPNVATDEPILASTANQLINNVNSSPGAVLFTANGLWTVPTGIHKFKVTIVGGGGLGGDFSTVEIGSGGDGSATAYVSGIKGVGGTQAICYFAGVAIGTSFILTIGAGGNVSSPRGGTTSFGSTFSTPGGYGDGAAGDYEAATFPPGAPLLYGGEMLGIRAGRSLRYYGEGGNGTVITNVGSITAGRENGFPGCILIQF